MNINIKYLIIAGIVLLILLATHRNPVEERKKAMALEKASHGDPLVYSIEEYNKKHPHASGMHSGVVGGTGNSTGAAANRIVNGTGMAPVSPYNNNNANNPNARYQNPAMQQYYNTMQNGATSGYSQPNGANGQNGTQQQNNGYYPPPPLMNNGNQIMPPPSSGPQSMRESNKTKSGTQLAFSGSRVYRVDSNGVWAPLEDGTYRMVTGEPLVVRGGRKIIISN